MFSEVKILPAKEEHTATFIFLHGLGEYADEYIERFRNSLPPYMKLLCPQGDDIQFNAKGETLIRKGWYDVFGADQESVDKMDYTRSCRNLEELIEEESKNVPLRRIAVGGFSQGGSVALYVAVFYPDQLGALITLSTYILSKENLVKKMIQRKEENQMIPYFSCHGMDDALLPYISAQYSFHTFRKYFKPARFKAITDMGHTVIDEEIQEVCNFLTKQIPYTYRG